jgi:hypothetical protein
MDLISLLKPYDNSIVMIGLAAFISNIGGRFFMNDIMENHGDILKKIIKRRLFRIFVLFCIFYVAIRNIYTAILLTLGMFIVLEILLNDNSPINVYRLFPTEAVEAYNDKKTKTENMENQNMNYTGNTNTTINSIKDKKQKKRKFNTKTIEMSNNITLENFNTKLPPFRDYHILK